MTHETNVSDKPNVWLRLLFDLIVIFFFFLLIAGAHASVSIVQFVRFIDYFGLVS